MFRSTFGNSSSGDSTGLISGGFVTGTVSLSFPMSFASRGGSMDLLPPPPPPPPGPGWFRKMIWFVGHVLHRLTEVEGRRIGQMGGDERHRDHGDGVEHRREAEGA